MRNDNDVFIWANEDSSFYAYCTEKELTALLLEHSLYHAASPFGEQLKRMVAKQLWESSYEEKNSIWVGPNMAKLRRHKPVSLDEAIYLAEFDLDNLYDEQGRESAIQDVFDMAMRRHFYGFRADDRLQQQYAKAIHRLQECGIDLSTIPPNVPHQAVVILALNGFLATVPKGDLGSIMQYLRLHKQRLAIWAIERFPQHITVMPAKRKRRRKLVLDLQRIPSSDDPPTLGQIALGYKVLDVVEGKKGNRNFIYLGYRQICCTCSGFSRRSVQCEHVTTWKESHSDWRNCFRAKQPSDVSTNLS